MASEALTGSDNVFENSDYFDTSSSAWSKVIKMDARSFVMELVFRYAWIWILGLSVVAVMGIALGITVDLRWLVVGLLIVCVVAPTLLAFLYYYYGLQRGCFVNTLPHRIVIADDGLIARLVIPVSDKKEHDDGDNEDNTADKYRIRDEFFPFDKMHRFVIGNNSAIIPLKSDLKGFLWIPANAFNDESHLSDLLKLLDSKIKGEE